MGPAFQASSELFWLQLMTAVLVSFVILAVGFEVFLWARRQAESAPDPVRAMRWAWALPASAPLAATASGAACYLVGVFFM